MRRGDFLSIVIQGDFGKPRPALVVQSDNFNEHTTATVLLVSSLLIDAPLFRITVDPNQTNGLKKKSQIMVDKIMTVKKEKIGEPFGVASDEVMLEVSRCLSVFLGIAQ
jgi:mRNA interferase MazF